MAKVSELKDQARELERRGEVESALKIYRHILVHLEQTPAIARELPLYVKVGDLLLKQGDAAEATAMYERGAAAYARHGSAKSVIALCVKILRVDPSRTDAYTHFASELLAADHVAAAREVLEDYARRAKREGVLAELTAVVGRPEDAVRAAVEGILERGGEHHAPAGETASESEPEPEPEPEAESEPEPPVEIADQPPILAEPWETERETPEPEPDLEVTHDTASETSPAPERESPADAEPEPTSEFELEPKAEPESPPEPEPVRESEPIRFEEPFNPAAAQEAALAPMPEREPPRTSEPHEPAPPEPYEPRRSGRRPPAPRFAPMARRERHSRSRLLPIIVVLVVAGGGYALVKAGIVSLTHTGQPEAPAPAADTLRDTVTTAVPESAAAVQPDTGAPRDTLPRTDTARASTGAPTPVPVPAARRDTGTTARESPAAATALPAITPPNIDSTVAGAIPTTKPKPSKPAAPTAPRTSVTLPPGTTVHDVVVIRGLAVDSVSGTDAAYRVVQHTAEGTPLALSARHAGVGDTVGVSSIQIAAAGRNAAPAGSVRFWGLLVTVRGNVPADTLRAFIGRLALARGGR